MVKNATSPTIAPSHSNDIAMKKGSCRTYTTGVAKINNILSCKWTIFNTTNTINSICELIN